MLLRDLTKSPNMCSSYIPNHDDTIRAAVGFNLENGEVFWSRWTMDVSFLFDRVMDDREIKWRESTTITSAVTSGKGW